MKSMENVLQRMQVDFLLHSGVQLAGEVLHFSEGIFLRGSGWFLAEHDDALLGMTGHLFTQNVSSMKTDSICSELSSAWHKQKKHTVLLAQKRKGVY